ncbi:hypothetical protein L2E82_16323 [Cichorium intybus]|uniref:Uncharacterized protein n=1 Tax=Cichorium intybus TaxID=13427 RepID=A0ACB9F5Q6_CICIN|nr:hypothetical protein L2E82_16323 [Cichorium intybus]
MKNKQHSIVKHTHDITHSTPTANKGIKKKIVEALAKFVYDSSKEESGGGNNVKLSSGDCNICLAEYTDGEEICVLPMEKRSIGGEGEEHD